MNLDDFEVFVPVADALQPSCPAVVSWLQLSRRLRLQDDKLRRAVTRLEQRIGSSLIRTENRRFQLTDVAQRLHTVAQQFNNLCRNDFQSDEPELMTIEVHPALDPVLVMRACGRFLESWAEFVTLRLIPLTDSAVQNIGNRSTCFAVQLAETRDASSVEWLDSPIPWVLLVNGSGLQSKVAITSDSIAGHTIFFSGSEFTTMPARLKTLKDTKLIECATAGGVLEAVRANLGLGCVPLFGTGACEWNGLRMEPMPNVEPLNLGFLLPRVRERLSEAAMGLKEEFRRVFQPGMESEESQTKANGQITDSLSESNVISPVPKSSKQKHLEEIAS